MSGDYKLLDIKTGNRRLTDVLFKENSTIEIAIYDKM